MHENAFRVFFDKSKKGGIPLELFKLLGTIAIDNSNANSAIDDTTGKAKKSEGSISGAFKKVGAAVATYLAVDKVVSFGASCINAASDANAMKSQFSQVFGDMEEQASKSLSGIASSTGIVENRMKGSYTQIASFAKTTGMDTADALGLADRAMVAVADSAAFYDRSLEDTTESLQSFLKGNFENDAALGLSCTETTRNAAANALYGKSFVDLSESQKQLTLLQMVEDANKLSGALGQASRESDTWTNQTGNLQQAWTDSKATIGDTVLPKVVTVIQKISTVVVTLSEKFGTVKDSVQTFIDKAIEVYDSVSTTLIPVFVDFKNKMVETYDYISVTLKPIFDDLKVAFDNVKEALQPIIDKFADYVTSGDLAEDTTNAIKAAADLLKDSYDKIKTLISDIVDGFKDAVTWGKEHKNTLIAIMGATVSLTAAIAAYTIANSIKNAGGIVEVAQLGILQVQIWALTAAETAHTVATTIATAATSAFGAVLAFVTSPITLIVLGIGALITIIVLLARNWDEVKKKTLEVWDSIKKTVQKGIDKVSELLSKVINFVKDNWQGLLLLIVNPFAGAFKLVYDNCEGFKKTVDDAVEAVKNFFAGLWAKLKNGAIDAWNGITGVFSSVADWFSEKFSKAWQAVKDVFSKGGKVFDGIKEGISDTFKTVVNGLIGGINKVISVPFKAINGMLNTIHDVSVAGIEPFSDLWSRDPLPVPEIPELYRGGVLEKGQVGLLEGNGAEAVVPLENNAKWIQKVAEDMNTATSVAGNSHVLHEIRDLLKELNNRLPDIMIDALACGLKLDINSREFARLVKAVE